MFKVGDWVRTIDDGQFYQLVKVNEEDEEAESERFTLYFHELELWKPKVNEWCWYTKNGSFVKCLEYVSEDEFEGCYLHGSDAKCKISDCEPFIGVLPSFLKDKE